MFFIGFGAGMLTFKGNAEGTLFEFVLLILVTSFYLLAACPFYPVTQQCGLFLKRT